MGFQWDAEKDAANFAKHGIGFRQAVEIFRGFTLSRVDDRRDGDIRVISAWKAGKHERRSYAEAHEARQV